MERLRRGFGGGAGAGAAARLNAMLDAEPDGAAQAHQEGSPMVDVVEDPVATAAGERGGQGERERERRGCARCPLLPRTTLPPALSHTHSPPYSRA